MTLVVAAESLSKRYLLGQTVGSSTVADALGGLTRIGRRASRRELYALRDVSFEIAQGEVVGLIGRNGAGKSTLLKILARITDPTSGGARIRGRVGALLEVGTAFHWELTGRENIRINGMLLGMTRREVNRRFDEIVEFAGIEKFLDTPLKRYSSGMYLRLAFSVAAHFEPDIVAVDEVLAVGDAEFQKRCLGKMSELGRDGRTVIFVSHDLGAIGQLCSRAMWLQDGRLRDDGRALEVIARYLEEAVPAASSRVIDAAAAGTGAARVRGVSLVDPAGDNVEIPARGDPFAVRLTVEVREYLPSLEVAVWVVGPNGGRTLDEALVDDPRLVGSIDSPGLYTVTLALTPVLPAGDYALGAYLGSSLGVISDHELLRFTVLPRADDRNELAIRQRYASPAASWSVQSATGPDAPRDEMVST